MKQYEILGHKVTFDEETHTYTVDGVEVPSVSTILGETLFKRKYSGVNPEILNAAAIWGNQVHVAIEDKNPMLLNETQEQRYNEFWQIIEEEKLDIISQEEIVFYEHNGKVVYIGRYDLSLKNGQDEELGDIKCTYNLDMNYLSWQLNLYRMAKEQMYKKKIKGLKAFWLPKRQKGKMREVAMKENEELLEFIGGLS